MTAPTTEPTDADKPPTEPDTKPAGDPPADTKPDADWEASAGKGGKAAVLADLAAAKQKAKAAEAELTKYRKAEQDKADADKTEAEKRVAAEERATAAELKVVRLEVAAEKGLTPAQAKRLIGSTREELEADADDIITTLPAAPAKPNAPAPDPSQGPRGTPPNTRPTSLGQAVAGALKKA